MRINLETKIGKISFKNPILAASGTFGHAKEFEKFMDLRKLGGIVTKTITIKPRLGNPPPRIVETPSGMLNAIGLQNPGAEKFIEEKLPYMQKLGIPIIVSVMGYSKEEFVEVVNRFEKAGGFDGFEMNLSCPNVCYKATKMVPEARSFDRVRSDRTPSDDGAYGIRFAAKMFAHDSKMIEEVVTAVRKVTKRTLIAKLGPDVSDIGLMASAAERAGADAVSLINTFVAMVIDINTRKPVLANKTGGLSGPCVRPIAVRMVWEACRVVKIPVLGMGGIMNAQDALEFLIAGASALQIGTANFMNPSACTDILKGLEDFMKNEKTADIQKIIGSLNI